ncbi:DUF3558 domain-containing protein [Nocardia sp. BMG51109]|uniref:DUF3558 domain-containing protein n=1 Tax=Nocardia sp. BMG51109 TaxID=1056816 RepID=UPI000467C9A3|nr:DUF3558 domain-containing protein [Nocardia sp. BMG51109]
MISRGIITAAAATAGALLLLTGCGSSEDGDAKPAATTATQAADVPRGFDPCNDIPQETVASEGLQSKIQNNYKADGGKILWHGCQWASSDSYGARIQTTNITVDMVRDKHFPDSQEFTINGRRAISSRQVDEHPSEACTIDVEMKGGSLEFNVSNPAYLPKTGTTDTCQLTRGLAEKVVPLMPPTA